jgi:hypothetical protein
MTKIHWDMAEVGRRCIEDGPCLIWQGSKVAKGYPGLTVDGKRHEMRRYVYTVILGKKVPRGHRVTTKCGNRLCVSEECLTTGTQGEIIARSFHDRLAKQPTYIRRYQAMPAAIGIGKLDHEKVEAIRNSGLSLHEIAEKWGVSYETARVVMKGETWRKYGPANSVFNLAG